MKYHENHEEKHHHKHDEEEDDYDSDAELQMIEVFVTRYLEFGACYNACPPQVTGLAGSPADPHHPHPHPSDPEVTITLLICESEGHRGEHKDPETRPAQCEGCHRTIVYYETVDTVCDVDNRREEHPSSDCVDHLPCQGLRCLQGHCYHLRAC